MLILWVVQDMVVIIVIISNTTNLGKIVNDVKVFILLDKF